MDLEISSNSDMPRSEIKKLLDERAEKLAKVHVFDAVQKDGIEYLSFNVGDSCYLLEAGIVVEVVRYKDVTPLPGVNNKLAGIFNFRGSILGVMDGVRLLDGNNNVSPRNQYMIICSYENVNFAISCEEINGIQKRNLSEMLENSSIDLLPSIITGVFGDSARCIDFKKLVKDECLKIS